ncbi:hypothetical protein [Mycobacteroides salmoniphilum]|uniref:Uncharacterized protein n=1 Tax=Mycobacteroides salmoniphilum TaxID=404941 RepID=A0A4R8SUW6_9MYCO|nr:hypothetical protein [Mycobacteroides salmoniphilum]TEA06099.1 hypothetical protein CCUG60884_01236 [Mycobacteroides salmoniphilum]
MTEQRDADTAGYVADTLAELGIAATVDQGPGAVQAPEALVRQVAQALGQAAPADWQTLHAVFSMAGGAEIAQVMAVTPEGNVAVPVESRLIEPIRTHRRVSVGESGPWLRLLFACDRSGELRVSFDYCETPPPPDQLLPGDAYLRDFQEYPRNDAPVWLLAHMGNEGQQMRSAADARRDASSGLAPALVVDDEIPPLPLLWARIAVLAAVCRGSAAADGPRCDPAYAAHDGEGGGCVIARLPGDRAVLSGGRIDSPLLSAAYKGELAWPDLYRGAPAWLHNLYLDPRAAAGLLSFCYWWDGAHWYRAEIPEAAALAGTEPPWNVVDDIVRGMPGVWTTASTAELVDRVLVGLVAGAEWSAEAPTRLVRAAESASASEAHLMELFPDGVPDEFDVAEALAQLDAAGVLGAAGAS